MSETATLEPPPDLVRSPRRSNPRNNGHPGRVDRLPPHSNESEQFVLGAALMDPVTVVPNCIGKINPQDFYDLRHQTIYETIVSMWDDRDPIGELSVYQRLQAFGKADECGGLTYLSSLPDVVHSAADHEHFITVVRDQAALRRMINVCTQTVNRIYESPANVPELLDSVERDVLQAAESRQTSDTPTTPELVRQVIANFENYYQNHGQVVGLDTGYADLNGMTTGLRNGDMIVVAARPSVGKTSLAMNIAEHVAVNNQLPVGVFSLEMTAEALIERMLASRARVNLRSIRDGFLAERDLPRITGTSGQIARAPLYIEDHPGTILEIRAKARRMHQQHNLRLIVIDYLQLIVGTRGRNDNRQQEVADISKGIKNLAKELNVPVIVLSQLNRDVERENNRKPRLSDLRESGSIEQDADVVGLLYNVKDREENNNRPEQDSHRVDMLIAKQRNGPTGVVNLTFFKSFTRFESCARIIPDDAPEPQEQSSLPYNNE